VVISDDGTQRVIVVPRDLVSDLDRTFSVERHHPDPCGDRIRPPRIKHASVNRYRSMLEESCVDLIRCGCELGVDGTGKVDGPRIGP
jgi:hypothetical protein